jgi:RNA polymerase sigma-70 factor (ECF subfamily)
MDEKTLVEAAQKGDLTAFNRLVLAYQSMAYNVAYRIMGDLPSAEDATQEAFISAYRGIKRFRGGSFRAWLMRIVTNACYDELRRRKRRPQISFNALAPESDSVEPEGLDILGTDSENPEFETYQGELAEAIQDCINRLPPEFRTVLVLVDVQGYAYQEASSVIERPVGTVKSRLARARERMRNCLQRFRELLPASLRLEDEALS